MNPFVELYREAVESTNRQLSGFNQKYVNDDLMNDQEASNRYNREIVTAINEKLLNIAVYRRFSLSRAKTTLVSFNESSGNFDLPPSPTGTLFIEPERNPYGFIVRLWLPEAYLSQTEVDAKNFLAHYGVKGMKWGVRKDGKPGSRRARKNAQKVGASKDAKRRANIQNKAKTSGTDALTNLELSTAINRMNLEVSYARLNEQTRKKSVGEKALKFLMNDVAEVEVKRVVKGKSALVVEQALADHGQADVADRIKPKKKK